MPGKGAYWKKGGLIDETVKEEDLSLALQAKVNAVGGGGHEILDEGSSLPQRGRLDFKGDGVVATDGEEDTTVVTIDGGGGGSSDTNNLEFLGETILGSNNQLVTVTFTSPADLDDYCAFEAYFVGTLNNNTNVGWQVNGLTTGYINNNVRWTSSTVQANGLADSTSIIVPGGTGGSQVFSKLIIQGGANLKSIIAMMAHTYSDQATNESTESHGRVATSATQISSVTMNGLSEDYQTGSRLCVYGLRKDGGVSQGSSSIANTAVLRDDFVLTDEGLYDGRYSLSSGSLALPTAEKFGVVDIDVDDAVTGNWAELITLNNWVCDTGQDIEFTQVVKFNNISGLGVFCGLVDSSIGSTTGFSTIQTAILNGIGFLFAPDLTGSWIKYTTDGVSSDTGQFSGVVPSSSTFQILKFRYNKLLGQVEFFIDGVKLGDAITATIPADTVDLKMVSYVANHTAVQHTLSQDLWEVLTPRVH